MVRRPPRSTRTAPLFPYTPRCGSVVVAAAVSVVPVAGPLYFGAPFGPLSVAAALAGLAVLAAGIRIMRQPAVRNGIALAAAAAVFYGFTFLGVFPMVDALWPSRTLARVVDGRSEEHTSELQSLMRSSSAGFCLKKKK